MKQNEVTTKGGWLKASNVLSKFGLKVISCGK